MVIADRLSKLIRLPVYLLNIEQDISILVFTANTDYEQINNNSRIDDTDLKNVWKEWIDSL